MRRYKIAHSWHNVYEDLEEAPKDLKIKSNWRNADIGDWILSDDNCVIQVLRKGKMKKTKLIKK